MKFTGKFINRNSALWYNGILVPEKTMKLIKELDYKRFIVTINDTLSFPGAAVPTDENSYIILVNKQRAKKLKLDIGDQVDVELAEDKSKYGMPMPDEFAEVLYEDPEGKDLLEKLTPGKIRSLIYLVSKIKNPDKRIEKSVIILEHLKANLGVLDYKMLNQAFKDYNQR